MDYHSLICFSRKVIHRSNNRVLHCTLNAVSNKVGEYTEDRQSLTIHSNSTCYTFLRGSFA
nr:MAG TPA: hypothetical protein [Caudoviricetes sp.]